jgi:hypothetical protein
VLGPDPDDEVAAGAGLPNLRGHLGRELDVAEAVRRWPSSRVPGRKFIAGEPMKLARVDGALDDSGQLTGRAVFDQETLLLSGTTERA